MRAGRFLSRMKPLSQWKKERRGESVIELAPANVFIQVHDISGRLVHEDAVHNRVTDVGRNILRDLLLNVGQAPTHMSVGTSADAAVVTDTGLQNEVYRALISRKLAASGKPIFKLFLATTDANGNTLQEIGLFRGANYNGTVPLLGGSLFARATFAPIVKDNTVQVTFTWEFPITSTAV